MRARRSQHCCRTEDVRTITEEDTNTDRWKIETPAGIGNDGERSPKEAIQCGEMSKQLACERDGESNENKLEARIVKFEEQTKWMYDKMTAAAEPSTYPMEIRRRGR